MELVQLALPYGQETHAASQEQAVGIDQVNEAVMEMDQTTQQNAALVEESASVEGTMQGQAVELQQQAGSSR